MNCVVNFSGGAASYCAAKRAIAKYGRDNTTLLFCDTKTEDADLYRFIDDAVAFLGVPLVTLADGRDIWQLFKDKRMLGNSRMSPCSYVLKAEQANKWYAANHTPDSCVRVYGIGWDESHRHYRLAERLKPWVIWSPMTEAPYLDKRAMLAEIEADGIKPPRLYALGAPHNNCGGGCVKAGTGHFAWLYHALPCKYAEWERKEQEVRDHIGKDVGILRVVNDGKFVRPMTLRELREKLESNQEVDMFDFGGCGCAVDVDAALAEGGDDA